MRDYAHEEEALTDVLRLSEAMSLKASLAGLDAAGLSPGLGGKRAVIQGVGKVGMALARYLIEAGAEVRVSDVNPERLREAERLGARLVANETVHREACDLLAPCATGAL